MKKFILMVFAFGLLTYVGNSRAQYSILQTFGTKCENCHYNTQGGGVRNNPGWLSRKDIALLSPSKLGIGKAFDNLFASNQIFNDKVTVGLDFRLQNGLWTIGSKKEQTTENIKQTFTTERNTMIMQLTPYLIVEPSSWISFEGLYNIAYELDERHYPGQVPTQWSINLKPAEVFSGLSNYLPSLRMGYFQPTLGTKYDDHTLLIHRVINSGDQYARPLKPDDYAEWGMQLDYQKISWLGLSAGIFQSRNIATSLSTKLYNPVATEYAKMWDKGKLVTGDYASLVGRVSIHPNVGGGINTFMGAMMLYNGPLKSNRDPNEAYFRFVDLFFHIGLSDKVALMTEYTNSYKQYSRSTNNFLIELDYQIMDAINVFVRAERATTTQPQFDENNQYLDKVTAANQFVIGTHIFPFPFIDILPEYRIYRSEEFLGTQSGFAVQLHVFY